MSHRQTTKHKGTNIAAYHKTCHICLILFLIDFHICLCKGHTAFNSKPHRLYSSYLNLKSQHILCIIYAQYLCNVICCCFNSYALISDSSHWEGGVRHSSVSVQKPQSPIQFERSKRTIKKKYAYIVDSKRNWFYW